MEHLAGYQEQLHSRDTPFLFLFYQVAQTGIGALCTDRITAVSLHEVLDFFVAAPGIAPWRPRGAAVTRRCLFSPVTWIARN